MEQGLTKMQRSKTDNGYCKDACYKVPENRVLFFTNRMHLDIPDVTTTTHAPINSNANPNSIIGYCPEHGAFVVIYNGCVCRTKRARVAVADTTNLAIDAAMRLFQRLTTSNFTDGSNPTSLNATRHSNLMDALRRFGFSYAALPRGIVMTDTTTLSHPTLNAAAALQPNPVMPPQPTPLGLALELPPPQFSDTEKAVLSSALLSPLGASSGPTLPYLPELGEGSFPGVVSSNSKRERPFWDSNGEELPPTRNSTFSTAPSTTNLNRLDETLGLEVVMRTPNYPTTIPVRIQNASPSGGTSTTLKGRGASRTNGKAPVVRRPKQIPRLTLAEASSFPTPAASVTIERLVLSEPVSSPSEWSWPPEASWELPTPSTSTSQGSRKEYISFSSSSSSVPMTLLNPARNLSYGSIYSRR